MGFGLPISPVYTKSTKNSRRKTCRKLKFPNSQRRTNISIKVSTTGRNFTSSTCRSVIVTPIGKRGSRKLVEKIIKSPLLNRVLRSRFRTLIFGPQKFACTRGLEDTSINFTSHLEHGRRCRTVLRPQQDVKRGAQSK